jgi:hypothetical protein
VEAGNFCFLECLYSKRNRVTLQDGTTELLADCMLELSHYRTVQEKYTVQLMYTVYIAGLINFLKV